MIFFRAKTCEHLVAPQLVVFLPRAPAIRPREAGAGPDLSWMELNLQNGLYLDPLRPPFRRFLRFKLCKKWSALCQK